MFSLLFNIRDLVLEIYEYPSMIHFKSDRYAESRFNNKALEYICLEQSIISPPVQKHREILLST